MLAQPNEHEALEKPVFTSSFYFNTDELDALLQSLKDKVKVYYPIDDFEWEMREFGIL